jgi:FkbM family methyltransferase
VRPLVGVSLLIRMQTSPRRCTHLLAMSSSDANFLLDTVPRWSWPGEASSSPGPELNVSFYVSRSRGLKFVQTDARGEGFVKDVFRLMASGCTTEASPATIVDIGANTGYYSMLAAVFGCPVIAFEPQPGCWPSFEAARVRNALGQSKVRYIPKPVSSRAAVIEVPSRGCAVTNQAKTEVGSEPEAKGGGRAGAGGRAGRRRRGGGKGGKGGGRRDAGTTTVSTVSMEEVLRGSSSRVRLVKIDTEGAEVSSRP